MLGLQIYNTAVDSDEFYDFLKDPSIPKSQKKPALEGILEKMGCHEITRRFFCARVCWTQLAHGIALTPH